MMEEWPWRGSSLGPTEMESNKYKREELTRRILSSVVIGEECRWRIGKHFLNKVGPLARDKKSVMGVLHGGSPKNQWNIGPREKWMIKNCKYNNETGLFLCNDPVRILMLKSWRYPNFGKISINKVTTIGEHQMAYSRYVGRELSQNYPLFSPSGEGGVLWELYSLDFFLLPGKDGDDLRVLVYEALKRDKKELIGGFQKQGNEECPLNEYWKCVGQPHGHKMEAGDNKL